jgi:hypothetical protein
MATTTTNAAAADPDDANADPDDAEPDPDAADAAVAH